MLSPAVQDRLEAAQKAEGSYHPNAEVAAKLGNKVLIMLVGPAAVGKSYVMNQAVALDPDFQRVPVFSTREARPDDEPGMFRCYPHDDEHVTKLLNDIDTGVAVQYAIHPTQGIVYGTLPEDYPGKYNLLATLSGVVDGMRTLPFESTHVVGVTPMAAAWQTWFDERYPLDHPERTKRLKEAVLSLQWLLDDQRGESVSWVLNPPGSPEFAAEAIINMVKYGHRTDRSVIKHARETLGLATELARQSDV